MKDYLKKTSSEEIYKFINRTILTLFYSSIIIFIVVFLGPTQDNILILFLGTALIVVEGGLILYIPIYFGRYFNEVLLSDIDLVKYRDYFTYAYRTANNRQKKGTLQSSYLADAQYHYFRGEFAQSLQSLSEIDIKKASWNRRRILPATIAYYRLANKLNQKDFTGIEEELASYQKMSGKGIGEGHTKLTAIYTVMSGQVTDYFDRVIPKYKLHRIEASYYQALNHLNQNQTEEAKACFAQIAEENPDLFYVREAKKYLEELS